MNWKTLTKTAKCLRVSISRTVCINLYLQTSVLRARFMRSPPPRILLRLTARSAMQRERQQIPLQQIKKAMRKADRCISENTPQEK